MMIVVTIFGHNNYKRDKTRKTRGCNTFYISKLIKQHLSNVTFQCAIFGYIFFFWVSKTALQVSML